jgi:transposase-like protein
VIADGHLGIWGALAAVFPALAEQRCWNHRILNGLDRLPKKLQAEARALLTAIPYAETCEAAERAKRAFPAWCTKRGVGAVGRLARPGLGAPGHLLRLPARALEASAGESPFAAVRRRTAAANRFKKVENATVVIWKTLLVAARSFRRLDAPERLAEVAEGVLYVNGERISG